MKKLNNLKLLLSAILFLSLTKCTIKPPDVYVFENLDQHQSTDAVTGHQMLTPSPACMKQIGERACGHGVSIVSGKEIYVGELPAHQLNKKPWSVLKAESVYLPAVESYAPLAGYIIDSCKKMNCSKQVDAFKVKLDSLNGVAGAINQ